MTFLKERKLNKIFPVLYVSRRFLKSEMDELADFNSFTDKEKEDFVLDIADWRLKGLTQTIIDGIGNNDDIDAYIIYEANMRDFVLDILHKTEIYGENIIGTKK